MKSDRVRFFLRRLIVITAIMALAHAFVGYQYLSENIIPARFQWPFIGYLALSVLLMLSAFLSRFILENKTLRETLSWLGMLAMGVFSSLFVFTFIRLLLAGIGVFVPEEQFGYWQTFSAYGVFLAISVAVIWGYLNARMLPVVESVKIELLNLPVAFNGFKLVQLSDIHIGPTIKRDYLAAVVEKVNQLEPDLVVITGDLVDGSVDDLHQDVAPLANLRAAMGVYFVTGNHEYYSGALPWIDYLRSLGVNVLVNEHHILRRDDACIALAGVTDFSAGSIIPEHQSKPAITLQRIDRDIPVKILLAHQPRTAIAAEQAGADLQLSGHTHGGQFWPWNYFVRLQQPYNFGLHKHGNLQLYINRGTGYWGPPKRLFKRAEITMIKLQKNNNQLLVRD